MYSAFAASHLKLLYNTVIKVVCVKSIRSLKAICAIDLSFHFSLCMMPQQ